MTKSEPEAETRDFDPQFLNELKNCFLSLFKVYNKIKFLGSGWIQYFFLGGGGQNWVRDNFLHRNNVLSFFDIIQNNDKFYALGDKKELPDGYSDKAIAISNIYLSLRQFSRVP